MKKCALLLLVCARLPGWSLDWSLPVFTLRYEHAGGASEDPDEQTLLPSSTRDTVSLRVREDAGPAVFGLTLRGSAKDYLLQAGDYSYLEAEQDSTFRLSDAWKLGATLGVKSIAYPEPDAHGLSKDSLTLKAAGAAEATLRKGTSLEAGLGSTWDLAENAADTFQAWVVTAAVTSRLGDWLLGARYRGEFRFPLGAESSIADAANNTASVSLQWDPNR